MADQPVHSSVIPAHITAGALAFIPFMRKDILLSAFPILDKSRLPDPLLWIAVTGT